MDALKNAAKSALSGSGNTAAQPQNTTATAGQPQAQTGATAGGSGVAGMINKGIDAAQTSGHIPKTGTQQGNMVDAGQTAFTNYENKQPK
ncbi:hypothetical protein HDU89_003800 [Geranomyces variabilis]|nr:hypothetical protein HDU89_003800 [Geranomyces variabilis]